VITHVFDSSAILAHYLQENGAAELNEILLQNDEIGISVLSLVELKTKFDSICPDPTEAVRVFQLYTDEIATALPVDKEIVGFAIELREKSHPRLPWSIQSSRRPRKRLTPFSCIATATSPAFLRPS
jgi:PIN domain nuclease of toxin-antitoxin system